MTTPDLIPKRIQRKRTKGWKMPEGAIYVGRPTKWGNPFTIVNGWEQGFLIYDDSPNSKGGGFIQSYKTKLEAQKAVVKLFKKSWSRRHPFDLLPLRGHDLACWCALDEPCHADILLKLANRETK